MSSQSINPIGHLARPLGLTQAAPQPETESPTAGFEDMLNSAITSLANVEQTADDAITQFAAGEDIELHQVMMAVQEADIAFQVAIEVRNKMIDAYQEISRISV